MKKALIGIFATALVAGLVLRILPWWCGSLIACVVMYFLNLKPGKAFLLGFIGVGLAWAIIAGWIDYQNHSILSERIGELFMGMSPFVVILSTAFMGALSGGLGGMTGGILAAQGTRRNPSSP